MVSKENASIVGRVVFILGVILSIFHIWTLNFRPLPPDVFRSICVGLILSLVFLLYDYRGKKSTNLTPEKFIFLLLTVISMGYAGSQMENILQRGGVYTTQWDIVMGIIAVVVVLEATRRTVGKALPIIASVFLLYAYFGKFLPGYLGHRGYSLARIITLVYTYEGIFGTPIAVVGTFVVMFIIFGAFLDSTGAGNFFLELAKSLTGRQRGGPAKIAVIASGFFGSISGSAVANVAATGTFTIPLMKKTGYSPTFAGAVEAAASTGGQFMPPIMAAGAFLMAEILGVPYTQVMLAAIIPAVIYYIVIWLTIDLRAAKIGLRGLSKEQVPPLRSVLSRGGYMIAPLIILVFTLVGLGQSPIRAAFWSMLSCIIILIFKKRDLRIVFRSILDACYDAAEGIIGVGPACACAGIVIACVGLTGLGLKIADIVIGIAGARLWLALILAMVVTIIFGMGLPTTVSYILACTILAPALIELGIVPIAAHFFIFYYASLSGITPPVALAAYTGAGIAGSEPMKTGFEAVRIAIAGFLLPFIIAYNPVFLLVGDMSTIIQATITAIIGCYALTGASEGWLFSKINLVQRGILAMAAILMIRPGTATDIIGIVSFALVLIWNYLTFKGDKEYSLRI